MKCEDIVNLLQFEKDEQLREHLASCKDCQRNLPLLRLAIDAIRRATPAALSGHLSADQVVTVALQPERLASESDDLHHVENCPRCRAEVAKIRRIETTRFR
jgi:hypothetical protein